MSGAAVAFRGGVAGIFERVTLMIADMETDRLEALRRYAVLDTAAEREFD